LLPNNLARFRFGLASSNARAGLRLIYAIDVYTNDVRRALLKIWAILNYPLDHKPDQIHRNRKAVDFIFKGERQDLAVEHTLLESYSGQLGDTAERVNDFETPTF